VRQAAAALRPQPKTVVDDATALGAPGEADCLVSDIAGEPAHGKTLEDSRLVISPILSGLVLTMPSDERERLIRRVDSLKKLQEQTDDPMAKTAITEEIAMHEALIANIDNTGSSEKSSG
jgi:hypothetical protein